MKNQQEPTQAIDLCPIAFPLGEKVFDGTPLYAGLFAHVDRLLEAEECPTGRLDIENESVRLSCLIHKSRPYMAGVTEGGQFSAVPLYDFARRASELGPNAVCSLLSTEAALVVMIGVHFAKRPTLQASTKLVDAEHLARHLAEEGQDAAVAFERDGSRTLLFLSKGRPARLYFGETHSDPGEGTIVDRLRDYAFSPIAPVAHVEVFSSLKLEKDPDAGVPLAQLAASIEPPPAVTVHVHYEDGREVRQRPFTPPAMIVGRDPTVDLFIDNLAVSRRHATLRWERGEFVVEDLGSANGTGVNGDAVNRHVVVPGDRIGIGKFTLTLVEHRAAPVAQETLFIPMGEIAADSYLVGPDLSVKLDEDIVLGKGPGVDVEVKGFFVGHAHARIHVENPGGIRFSCFGRRTVVLNGRKVDQGRLKFGDRLEIGRSKFTISPSPTGGREMENALS